MIKRINIYINRLSWQTKLVMSGSSAIFLTFFLFSFLEYHTVSKWMMNREEIALNRTIADISTFYKEKADLLTRRDFENSGGFLRKMNDKDQLIRVYDQTGEILVSDKNGEFSVLEPTPVKIQMNEKVSIEGNEALIARYPIKANNFTATIEIVRQLFNYNKMMGHLFWVMTIFGIIAILFSAISGFFLARQLLKPVRELTRAMKRIKENGFQGRMAVYKQKDEFTDLTNVFNEMMDEIEKSFLQQKQFVEDASHELRTPVSILEGHLSLLNRWGKKDPAILEESLGASLQEITRLKKLIITLLDLTRAENPRMINMEKADIHAILLPLLKNLEVVHPEFHFKMELAPQLPMIAISDQHLEQVLIILIDNSIKYASENKTILISAQQIENGMMISVKDSGIGIGAEHIKKVFNRFYRIDKARSRDSGGTGLGLSIAKQLIRKHNGTISIESNKGVGTMVKVVLPIVFTKDNG
ncbi:HAMP domain-containing sensor histidine kinase [Neobacillus soli]|uniref:HAMP domain-containing sensor histidine kinase n=1 Tax=Neobacillus soli TaxID=220688 RepID=UPI0008245CCF|nr:HAMP domain-containing histidine kinase [Neobacillus soli]